MNDYSSILRYISDDTVHFGSADRAFTFENGVRCFVMSVEKLGHAVVRPPIAITGVGFYRREFFSRMIYLDALLVKIAGCAFKPGFDIECGEHVYKMYLDQYCEEHEDADFDVVTYVGHNFNVWNYYKLALHKFFDWLCVYFFKEVYIPMSRKLCDIRQEAIKQVGYFIDIGRTPPDRLLEATHYLNPRSVNWMTPSALQGSCKIIHNFVGRIIYRKRFADCVNRAKWELYTKLLYFVWKLPMEMVYIILGYLEGKDYRNYLCTSVIAMEDKKFAQEMEVDEDIDDLIAVAE